MLISLMGRYKQFNIEAVENGKIYVLWFTIINLNLLPKHNENNGFKCTAMAKHSSGDKMTFHRSPSEAIELNANMRIATNLPMRVYIYTRAPACAHILSATPLAQRWETSEMYAHIFQ